MQIQKLHLQAVCMAGTHMRKYFINIMRQGCSSHLVSLCVCIKSSIEQLIGQKPTYTDGLSTKRFNYNVRLSIKQPLCKITKFTLMLLTQLSAVLFTLVSACAHINHVMHNYAMLFSTTF